MRADETYVMTAVGSATNGKAKFFVNDTLFNEVNATPAQVTLAYPDFGIGASYFSSSRPYSGKIHAVMVYGAAIDDEFIQANAKYLMKRYNDV